MKSLGEIRAGKPAFYPDQSVYAEFACAEFGLAFQEIDGGTGLLFTVASHDRRVTFGAGRCSWYPQNDSTAASLATDKYFANAILERAGVLTLGGDYFFLHDRHRAHRPLGYERSDALDYFEKLGGSAFVKPLLGSRGDFAQAVHSEASLLEYFDHVSRYYDSVLIQPIASGIEYRVFLLDDEGVYSARKYPPFIVGDGIGTIRDLLKKHNAALQSRGLSPVVPASDDRLDVVLSDGAPWEIPGRMNLSAGGTMLLESPPTGQAVFAIARQAAKALGLRVAAVDLFTDVGGDSDAIRVIEVNSNPSIRLLEDSDRGDLILQIWHHTFAATGLLGV